MKVKVGDTWYEPSADVPIMVQLSKQDKINIFNMPAEATRYAIFHGETSIEERRQWMDEGFLSDDSQASPMWMPRESYVAAAGGDEEEPSSDG